MNEELIKNTEECYRLAEQKAADYFKSLYLQVTNKSYIAALTEDIQLWKDKHIHHTIPPFFSRRKGNPGSRDNVTYIQWLNHTGKLSDYLERSISYIYMRDLGKDLGSPVIQDKICRAVESLKKSLIQTKKGKMNNLSMAMLYRWAQKEKIESTIIWLINKLQTVSSHIPNGMDAENAQRKLVKIIAGVIMHMMDEMKDGVTAEERAQKLDAAVRLGYSYGLTYPFIDDLLDAKALSDEEKKQYSALIRTTLITGDVPDLGEWTGTNKNLIQFIQAELGDAFKYIKDHQRKETRKNFFDQAYVFFHSQEVDRIKDLSNPNYTNEELYLPVILKSSSSRLIVHSIISAPEDEGFCKRTFYYGIYNQLADDFADMFDDLQANAVTPYTYYIKYHEQRPDLINPFELYWTVIFHLIHTVYHSDTRSREVILDRAINGLKRFKEKMGKKKYKEVMKLFVSENRKFNSVIQRMVRNADEVDFFDKLLRDQFIAILKRDQKEQTYFKDTIQNVRIQINNMLGIPINERAPLIKDPIIDAANYSIEGDGKRLRPIMTWEMGINGYHLDQAAVVPLLRSLEYMHTASLIFDDLPSQDNSSTRRGRPTLHQVYNVAIAELTGLFLIQKATEEQASLEQFDSKTVLSLIRYSAKTAAEMCKGQAMDLDSKGKLLTLEQLKWMSFYKTGIAFEASLIMPAILACAPEKEINTLKKFACHAGNAFQIKDDLLDAEGNMNLLGKPVGKDAENNQTTFVTILGLEGARKELWEEYCLAMEALSDVPVNTSFLKQLMNYIVNRDH